MVRRPGIVLSAAAVLVLAACAAAPKVPPHALVPAKPEAATVGACWLEYLRAGGPAGPAVAGFPDARHWNGTISGLLVRHPKGDVLIDVGSSSHYGEEIAGYSAIRRAFLKQTSGRAKRIALPADALRGVGSDPSRLLFVILSHGHIDHAGGMVDLPGVKAMLSPAEWKFMQEVGPKKTIAVIPAHEKTLEGRTEEIAWQDVPYETFDRSFDVFGDGSVVIVPLPGHTPGSIGTFVNAPGGKRIFHVGDAVLLREQYRNGGVKKGYAMRYTDYDHAGANAMVGKLAQLHVLDPGLVILPAHDRDVWEALFGKPESCLNP